MSNGDDEKQLIEEFFDSSKKAIEDAHGQDPLLAVKATLSENSTLRQLAHANYRLFLITLFFLAATVLVAFIGWTRDTEYRYFYINEEGHVYETYGLNYPTITKARVTNFANEIATSMHSWNYRTYANNFTDLIDQCSPGVVEHYYNTMGKNGVLSDAERFKKSYVSVVTASRLVQERVIDSDGKMEWRVNLLLNEEATGTAEPTTRTFDIVIDVTQVPLSVSTSGLLCSRYDENYKK